MFAGSYEHSLDDKGRLVLPAQWRRQFEDGAFLVVWENCLALFPPASFWEQVDVIQERIEQASGDVAESRKAFRYFLKQAREVNLDAGGRIVVPQSHREAGGITRNTLLIGVRNRVEIWDPGRWGEDEDDGAAALAPVISSMRL